MKTGLLLNTTQPPPSSDLRHIYFSNIFYFLLNPLCIFLNSYAQNEMRFCNRKIDKNTPELVFIKLIMMRKESAIFCFPLPRDQKSSNQ